MGNPHLPQRRCSLLLLRLVNGGNLLCLLFPCLFNHLDLHFLSLLVLRHLLLLIITSLCLSFKPLLLGHVLVKGFPQKALHNGLLGGLEALHFFFDHSDLFQVRLSLGTASASNHLLVTIENVPIKNYLRLVELAVLAKVSWTLHSLLQEFVIRLKGSTGATLKTVQPKVVIALLLSVVLGRPVAPCGCVLALHELQDHLRPVGLLIVFICFLRLPTLPLGYFGLEGAILLVTDRAVFFFLRISPSVF